MSQITNSIPTPERRSRLVPVLLVAGMIVSVAVFTLLASDHLVR